MLFVDRVEAGERLAEQLLDYRGNAIVLGIPRGGVIVGYEVARKLGVLLDIIVPRKIGAPQNPELAIGAVTEDGTTILDESLVEHLGVSKGYLEAESARQRVEIQRRLRTYRGDASHPTLEGENVIITDDGVATGATIRAALRSVWNKNPYLIVIAVPVAPPTTKNKLQEEADHVVCLATPEPFYAIGQFYRDFTQTRDEEVIRLLKRNRTEFVLRDAP